MDILVTGGLGTLGRPLVEKLRGQGHAVSVVDLQHDSGDDTFRADVGDSRQIERVIDHVAPDVVYHLAAEFGRKNGEEFYEQCWRTNVIGTKHILRCQEAGMFGHLVFASSSEAYGEMETDWLDEDLLNQRPPVHLNDYAMSKWINEQQIRNSVTEHNTKATVLRLFNAYGPGERFTRYRSVVCLFAWACLTHQHITLYDGYHRVFQYVDDLIATMAKCATVQPQTTLNVGGLEYCSVEHMLNVVIDAVGRAPAAIHRKSAEEMNIRNKRPVITRAQELLGHDPKTTLAEGIPLTVEWLRGLMD